MIKYGKWLCILLLAAFLVTGQLLIPERQPGVSCETAGAYIHDNDAGGGELLIGETLNVNTATAESLERIPGIGETLAQRIVDYRTENGSFSSPEELVNVKGIGPKTIEKISQYMRFDDGDR